jgi:cytochrome c oxidase subunit 4
MDKASSAPSAPSAGAHVVPLWIYLAVYVSLLGLTAATVWAAFTDLEPLSNAVAIGIALVKATLVALFFMHVRYSSRLIPLVLVAGVFWLIHLLGGTLSDYMTRDWLEVPGR